MRHIPIYLSLIALTSCSMMPSWMGDKDQKKLEGQRITLLKTEDALRPSAELAQSAVSLPPATENSESVTSRAGHLALAEQVSIRQTDSIGKSAQKSYHLPAPIVAEGKIFVLDGSGTVIATDANNIKSKALWKNKISPKSKSYMIGGGLAYHDGVIYATAGHNDIVALSAADGKEVWRKSVSNVVRAAPAAANGKVALITVDNHVYVMNAKDGSVLWTHEGIAESVGILGAASPSFAPNGTLLVPNSSGELHALNQENGRPLWSVSLSNNASTGNFPLNDIDVSPVIIGNVIFTVSNAGGLFAIDATSGNPLWKQEIPNIQSLWVAGNYIYAISSHNEVIAAQAQDGQIKWVTKLQEYGNEKKQKDKLLASGPVLAGSQIYVALSNGLLVQLSAADGKILKSHEIIDEVTVSPEVALGKLYLLSNNAKLEVLN